jgi:hypothetical protein
LTSDLAGEKKSVCVRERKRDATKKNPKQLYYVFYDAKAAYQPPPTYIAFNNTHRSQPAFLG